MNNIYGNDCAIKFDSNDYIILKPRSEIGFLELVLEEGSDFT